MQTFKIIWQGVIFSFLISLTVISLVLGNWLTNFMCLFFTTIWLLSTWEKRQRSWYAVNEKGAQPGADCAHGKLINW